MYTKVLLSFATLLVVLVIYVQSFEHGENGPLIIKTSDRRNKNSDLIMLGGRNKCGHGPTIIKSGKRRHGQDLILLGGSNNCHKKKVEHVPVHVPVKQYVPVPYKETVHVPVHIPVHIPVHVPMKKEEGGYGGGGGGDMGGFGGYNDFGGMDGFGWRR